MTRDAPTGDPGEYFENLLRFAAASHASDVHLAAGKNPLVRIDSDLRSVGATVASDRELKAWLATATV